MTETNHPTSPGYLDLGTLGEPYNAAVIHLPSLDPMALHGWLRTQRKPWMAEGRPLRVALIADTHHPADQRSLNILRKAVTMTGFELVTVLGPAAATWGSLLAIDIPATEPKFSLKAEAVRARAMHLAKIRFDHPEIDNTPAIEQSEENVDEPHTTPDATTAEHLNVTAIAAGDLHAQVECDDVETAQLETEACAEAERIAAAQEAVRLEAERQEAERIAAAQEAMRLEAERQEAERIAAAQEAVRLEAERQEAERIAAAQEAVRLEAERQEAERIAAAQEAVRLEAERQEAERIAAAQEAVRLEAERQEAERIAAAQEADRIEAERQEAERIAAAQAADQIEAERLARVEAARSEQQRLEKEQDNMNRLFEEANRLLEEVSQGANSHTQEDNNTGAVAAEFDPIEAQTTIGTVASNLATVETRKPSTAPKQDEPDHRMQTEAVSSERATPLRVAGIVRTGTVIEHDGDIIIEGSVHMGAEIRASGDIHVYGIAGGRLFAGVRGDRGARLYLHRFDAEIISIAGKGRLFEEVPERWKHMPTRIYFDETHGILRFDTLTLEVANLKRPTPIHG